MRAFTILVVLAVGSSFSAAAQELAETSATSEGRIERAGAELEIAVEDVVAQLRAQNANVELERTETVERCAYLESLDTRIAESRNRLSDLLLRFTEQHPEVVSAKSIITKLEATLAEGATELVVCETQGQ